MRATRRHFLPPSGHGRTAVSALAIPRNEGVRDSSPRVGFVELVVSFRGRCSAGTVGLRAGHGREAARRDRSHRSLRLGRATRPSRRRRPARGQQRQAPAPPPRPRRQPPTQPRVHQIAIRSVGAAGQEATAACRYTSTARRFRHPGDRGDRDGSCGRRGGTRLRNQPRCHPSHPAPSRVRVRPQAG